MKWGLITDTHNKKKLVNAAIAVFEREKCSTVFHCGDFESNQVLESFLNRDFAFHYVTDHDGQHDRALKEKYRKDYFIKTISGARVALYHNTYSEYAGKVTGGPKEPFSVKSAIESALYDFVFYGHLHFFNLKLPDDGCPAIAVNCGGFYHEVLSTFCTIDLEAAHLDLYYWTGEEFSAIVRFPFQQSFQNISILDDKGAYRFADALGQLSLNASDRCGHTFTDEDASWFNKNFGVLYNQVGYDNRPSFFY